jgi:HD-GYP domain-containing protein (c-di-GMP phosphodiesterase class II)
VAEPPVPDTEQVRTAEVIAAACLATDLGMGFPFEHGLQATLVTCRLAERLAVGPATRAEAFYVSLLMYSGCTTDSEINAGIFGGSLTKNMTARQFGSTLEALGGVIRALPEPASGTLKSGIEVAAGLPKAARFRRAHFTALCEVAMMLSERLGLPDEINRLFLYLTERWDGNGVLGRKAGDEIPMALRIVTVARDAAYQTLIGGEEHAARVIRERAGHAFDPDVAMMLSDNASEMLSTADDTPTVWDSVLDAEPGPHLSLDPEGVDRALGALGDFADLVSPSLVGHSAGVAQLAGDAATELGLAPAEVTSVRRAGLIHDIGRVAIDPRTWQKNSSLNADEWEQVRLHAYHTERVFNRSPLLAPVAAVACRHHERMDGSGYHRGLNATSLEPVSRLLAAADAFHAMTEPRDHRPPMPSVDAAAFLREESAAGRHDGEMVAAVLRAAGQQTSPVARPAGLTEREVQVIRLLARGLQTKQVARALEISAKTADRHIQNAYRKIGVSTRAAATLYASEHGLVQWGELPISP